MIRNPRFMMAAGLAAAAAGFLFWETSRSAEPSFRGRPLEYWLSSYDRESLPTRPDAPEWKYVVMAVKKNGTNGIPTLLRLMSSKVSVSPTNPAGFAAGKTQAAFDYVQAARGFQMLGVSASNAGPALMRIYDENESLECRRAVVKSMLSIGPLPDFALPSFIRATKAADPSVRADAVAMLGHFPAAPLDQVMPFLTNALNDPVADVRKYAAVGLSAFGSRASAAIPALTDHLNDSSPEVKSAASGALRKINPQPAGAQKQPRASN